MSQELLQKELNNELLYFYPISKWDADHCIAYYENGMVTLDFIAGKKYFGESIYVTCSETVFSEVIEKYKIDDICKAALLNGFVAVEQDGFVIQCGCLVNKCSEKCVCYNKCNYWAIKKMGG